MKKLILSLALLASLSAFAADRKYTDEDGNTAVLQDGPCQVEEFKNYKYFDKLKAAVVTVAGKAYKSCYFEQGDVVTIADAEGHVAKVPTEAFN